MYINEFTLEEVIKFYETYVTPYDFTLDAVEKGHLWYYFIEDVHPELKGLKQPETILNLEEHLKADIMQYIQAYLMNQLGWDQEVFVGDEYAKICISDFIEFELNCR